MKRKLQMALRWIRYATSTSYYHLPQGPGRAFLAGRLEGYFNDLTAKTGWTGPTDARGIPLHQDAQGRSFYFPITIAQKGLGHWDRWVLGGRTDAEELQAALNSGAWLAADQDDNGGWSCWDRMHAVTISPYSGMAQGQALSLLVRLHAATGDESWLERARHGFEFLTDRESALTVVRDFQGFPLLEEYPKRQVNGVLNGWIFAAFGLYDFAVATGESAAVHAARESFCAIDYSADRYDTGAWSAYDLNGRIASPFYHNLHVAQLTVLARVYPEGATVQALRSRFDSYRASTLRVVNAVSRKIVQKLREREYAVLA